MPTIVIGADTEIGSAIVAAATSRGETRAFVTDEAAAEALRSEQVKVAHGDISDASHVGGAALGCFCAILVDHAARDGREMAFSSGADAVVAAWMEAVVEAGVTRVVLVTAHAGMHVLEGLTNAPEFAVVDTTGCSVEQVVARVLAIDDARSL